MPITINGSTGISGVDGSAGTPALIGSDADTGIFLAAGQVSASINGTAGNVPLVSGTAKAWNWNGLTTNEFIDFENIPSWVKRVTVMFNGVSTNGTSNLLIQLGTSAGVTTTGYASYSVRMGTAAIAGGATFTTGFGIASNSATTAVHGAVSISGLGRNIWTGQGFVADTPISNGLPVAGSVTLSGTLDRIRITTVAAGATNQFDAGSINIMYE